ncbi:MAG: MFS transporter [Steroidobacteraceae bacterium]
MKNVWILAAAQALGGCGTIMLVAFGGIVGTQIAPTPQLATLPVSLAVVGLACATLPASLLMRRFGRKRVFMANAGLAAAAAAGCAIAVNAANFPLLCIASMIIGASMSVVQQYRFAATEFVPASEAGKAVGIVMLGTLAAALIGPGIGNALRLAIPGTAEFTGSFAVLAFLLLGGGAVLGRLQRSPAAALATTGAERSLAQIAAQPQYRHAVLAGVASYAVMSFIMTATPISMHVHDHFSTGETTSVISAHVVAMYVMSFFSGFLTRSLGLGRMMILGTLCMTATVVVGAFVGREFSHYFVGLALLGIGWNLLFVAGTTLLTRTYTPAERFKAQGCNDLLVFGSQAAVSLLAGTTIEAWGWARLNLATLPILAVTLIAAVVLSRRERASVSRPEMPLPARRSPGAQP